MGRTHTRHFSKFYQVFIVGTPRHNLHSAKMKLYIFAVGLLALMITSQMFCAVAVKNAEAEADAVSEAEAEVVMESRQRGRPCWRNPGVCPGCCQFRRCHC